MFGVGFTGGGANAPFSGSFTTNVVATCQSGNFLGLEGDLVYDPTLNVSVSGLNGATVSGSGRIVLYFANGVGVKSGTSVLRLSVSNKSLKDGQTANIKFQNVKGVCDGGTNTASATKSVKYVKPAPSPTKPEEPEEPEPDISTMSASELLNMISKDLPAEKLSEVKAALSKILSDNDERIKTLESKLLSYEESPVLGAADEEKSGLAKLMDNKWVFFGVGAVMAGLVSAAIAIICSLAKPAERKEYHKKAKAKS
jgi:hypothetical protein